MEIKIIVVSEKPSDKHWSYPLEEIDYIFEQIEDGFRENGCEFYLFEGRLYETEETAGL